MCSESKPIYETKPLIKCICSHILQFNENSLVQVLISQKDNISCGCMIRQMIDFLCFAPVDTLFLFQQVLDGTKGKMHY